MKVIVTGASGLLGRAVFRTFKNAGHDVIGIALTRADRPGFVKLNLTDADAVKGLMEVQQPEVVVHCAAERRPDVAEKNRDGACYLNVEVPRTLAKLAKANGFMLIYISTDYVFDGTNPPYQVDDVPNPLNFYGKTKLDGEKAVLEQAAAVVVLRVPVLYGETEYNAESAVNVLLDGIMNQSKPVDMDNVGLRYPTNVDDIGRVIKDLAIRRVQQGDTRIQGIFHFSAVEKYTKYTMAVLLANLLHLKTDHLMCQDKVPASAAASRPKDAHLSNDRLKDLEIDTTTVSFRQWWTTYLATKAHP
ncbi:RmlD-like substrate binding domain-containing protein [Dichotomocladium elegans]|nr:RmlD-like substrate binding domain-containing protein [Dichotomocladium elegans]